ncbi:MAG: hypothetical protein HOV87_23050 [Catenulispora sp.]|nr:hypothetical protein [Catenulispora sp.]
MRKAQGRESAEADPRWSTIRAEAEVLAVVRTVPTARRLLDVAEAFAGDPRVEVRWALDRGSELGRGVRDLLAAHKIRPLRLAQAVRRSWHLVLAASENSPLDRLDGPVFLVPHGAGHGKGMAAARLASCRPATIGLAHADDAARLAARAPDLGEAARVVGDPCWDRLAASRHRRAAYRRALGTGDARLVVLSSTWGPRSLFSRHTDLAARLTAALPWDSWRVAMVLHPGVRARHGEDAVTRWLRPALDRGLLLLDADDEWRAGLIAADAVIGDHGSVTLYGAALGVPTAFACFGWEEVDPEAAIARLGHKGFYFDADGPLLEQVTELSGEPGEAPLADQLFAHQGSSLERIAEVAYGLMEVPRPRNSAGTTGPTRATAVPIPRQAQPTPMAWWFTTRPSGTGIAVDRYPVSESMPSGARLLAHIHAPDPRHPALATIVVGTLDLAAYPGAYIAVDGDTLVLRSGEKLVAESALDPAVVATALHTWVFQLGRPIPTELPVNGSLVRFAASPRH